MCSPLTLSFHFHSLTLSAFSDFSTGAFSPARSTGAVVIGASNTNEGIPQDMPFMGALSMMNGPSPAERAQAKRQQRNLVSGLEEQLREKKIRELREKERRLRENLSSVEEKWVAICLYLLAQEM